MTMPADVKAYNKQLIEQFRAQGGAPDGRQLLLLTTTGAHTGRPHTTPMMFIPDGERLLVIASNAGAAKDPDWYRNLVAHPQVTVEVTGETYPASAAPLPPQERDTQWAQIVANYPFFADHQAKITRTIPVVALNRVS
jgi:deazaflavin-dependent oxidoreductase (nitroreductase family)